MDTYQGKMRSISPAIGPYDLNVYINIDKIVPTYTGGVTGVGTLVPIMWDIGVTGINEENFKNTGHGF